MDVTHEHTAKLSSSGTQAANTFFKRALLGYIELYIILHYIFCSVSFNFMLLCSSTSQGTGVLLTMLRSLNLYNCNPQHKAHAAVTSIPPRVTSAAPQGEMEMAAHPQTPAMSHKPRSARDLYTTPNRLKCFRLTPWSEQKS